MQDYTKNVTFTRIVFRRRDIQMHFKRNYFIYIPCLNSLTCYYKFKFN